MSASPSDPQELLERIDPRAGPLIISVFGDSLHPRGAKIWLGDLIKILEPFGLSQRLVRTGVYRLTREKWLASNQVGRRSYYDITDEGLSTFAHATSRIYAIEPRPWNGKWLLVQTLPCATLKQKKTLRKTLIWRGFGQLSPTMLIKPDVGPGVGPGVAPRVGLKSTSDIISNLGLSSCTAQFTSDLDTLSDPVAIAQASWSLDEFSSAYTQLLADFANVDQAFCKTGQQAFLVRTLLIHQYRRILLKDPQLPNQMLPNDWAGNKARQRVAQIYRQISPKADQYICDHLKDDTNQPLRPTPQYADRFAAS